MSEPLELRLERLKRLGNLRLEYLKSGNYPLSVEDSVGV